jgi:hypothetical protein
MNPLGAFGLSTRKKPEIVENYLMNDLISTCGFPIANVEKK